MELGLDLRGAYCVGAGRLLCGCRGQRLEVEGLAGGDVDSDLCEAHSDEGIDVLHLRLEPVALR